MEKKVLIGFLNDLLINSLDALKDEEFQRRVWFRREGPEVDSYIDTTCHTIELCRSLFKDPNCIEYLGKETYESLKKLHDLVLEHVDLTEERINVDYLQENELLDDPNWHDIQELSNEVYVKLTDFVNRHKDD